MSDNPQQPLQVDTNDLFSDESGLDAPNVMAVSIKNTSSTMMTPSSSIRRGNDGLDWTPGTTLGGLPPGRGGGGGLTMYERSMLQKEERERKMKALQERLMADFTFTPKSATFSSNNTLTPSPRPGSPSSLASAVSVFTRLYRADTAASRGQRRSVFTAAAAADNDGYYSTPVSTVSTPARTGQSPVGRFRQAGSTRPSSPRLEELYKSGEEKLRGRNLSDQDEAKALRRRLEEQELATGSYTFHPNTKWDLAAERRKLAQVAVEQVAHEARKATPKIVKAVSVCRCPPTFF